MYANNEPTVKPVVYDKVMILPKKKKKKIQKNYKKLVIIINHSCSNNMLCIYVIPANSRCPSGTLVGACIIGMEPTIPFVTPSKQESNSGYPSLASIGVLLGNAQSKNKGINTTLTLENNNN